MNAKEFDVKSIGKDGMAMEIVRTILHLRNLIESAGDVYDDNVEQAQQLHLLRTDMEHMMAVSFDADPVKDALMQQEMAKKYRDVQRRRRELMTEDTALEHIIFDQDFFDRLGDMAEAITGQLQFIDHAYYKPKSKLCGLSGG